MLVLTATATFCRAEEANKNNLEVRGKADDILRWWLHSTASFMLHTTIILAYYSIMELGDNGYQGNQMSPACIPHPLRLLVWNYTIQRPW